jgi:glycosyltransferase involved in cell wall biosynthesis
MRRRCPTETRLSDVPEDPKVTVVIPCFNDGALVPQTIASLNDSDAYEVVVVDDCSSEPETRRVLSELEADGTRVLWHAENRGVAAARNTGLAASRAPLVFALDADDLASPGALDAMVKALERNPDAVVAYGDYREFGEHDLLRAVPETVDPYRVMYTNEYPPTALLRRSFLETCGGWRTTRIGDGFYEDWDLWMTIAERDLPTQHMGRGFETYRQRVHGPRLLEAVKRNHVPIYKLMRSSHPGLFDNVRTHRKRSDLSRSRRLLYPVVYGRRRRFSFEPRVKSLLDRFGLWTLRR